VAIPAGPTIDAVLDRATTAYTALSELGEEIEDEWSYVQDLTEAWRGRFEEVRASRGDEVVGPEVVVAIDAAVGEIARISDPHRAIDWLSTFPQVTLLALGERP
jgi:hypothetical protein